MLTNTVTSTDTSTSNTYTVDPNYLTTNTYTWTAPTYSDISRLEEKVDIIQKILKDLEKEKESKKMANPFGLKCGQIIDGSACLTVKGIAVRNTNNQYVMYHDGAIEDVSAYVIKGNFLYVMPIAYKNIEFGDVIVYNNKYYTIISNEDMPDSFDAIELNTGEVKTLLPAKSPFGFNYLIKVVSPISLNVSEDEPFGNLPLLMMMTGDNKNLLPLLMLLKNDSKIDPMMLMMMSNI